MYASVMYGSLTSAQDEAARLATYLPTHLAASVAGQTAPSVQNGQDAQTAPNPKTSGGPAQLGQQGQHGQIGHSGHSGQIGHREHRSQHGLRLISYGDGQAVATWGRYAASGHWADWLKQRLDLAALARLRNVIGRTNG